jgi:hypothetical protein
MTLSRNDLRATLLTSMCVEVEVDDDGTAQSCLLGEAGLWDFGVRYKADSNGSV